MNLSTIWIFSFLILVFFVKKKFSENKINKTQLSFSEKELEEFYLAWHRKTEALRIRSKRQTNQNYAFNKDEEFSPISLKTIVNDIFPIGSEKLFNLLKRVITWSIVNNENNLGIFWTKIIHYDSGHKPMLNYAVLNPVNKDINVLYSSIDIRENHVSEILKSGQFFYRNLQYFVVLYYYDNTCELVTYKLIPRIENQSPAQLINTHSLKFTYPKVHFNLIEYQNNVYLGISIDQLNEGEIRLYKWSTSQFDLVADYRTEHLAGADSIELFKMSGKLYLVSTATSFRNQTENAVIFSQVITSSYKENLRLVQKINLKDESSRNFWKIFPSNRIKISTVKHYELNDNHYLMFIGLSNCKIFWWLESQFIRYQTLADTNYAKDLDASYLPNNEIVISLVTYRNELRFYSQSVSGQYVITFVKKFDPTYQLIETVKMISYKKFSYYVFLTFDDYRVNKPHPTFNPIYLINLVNVTERKIVKDPLMNCLFELKNLEKKNEFIIKDFKLKTNDVWVKNKRQVVTAPIVVRNRVEAKSEAKIGFLKIKSQGITPTAIKGVDVINMYKRLSFNTDSHLNETYQNLVFKNKNSQKIFSPIVFLNSIESSELFIDEITNKDVQINNVTINDLARNVLRKSGYQVIKAPIIFSKNLDVSNLNVKMINNLQISNLLLLDSKLPQVVTGNFIFNQVHSRNLFVSSLINDVYLNDIVRKNSNEELKIFGSKIFQNLNILKNINVLGLINGGDLQKLSEYSIKLNSNKQQICEGRIVFENILKTNTLEVKNPINNRVDFNRIFNFALKKFGNTNIRGKFNFENLVTVKGDAKIFGLVNGLNIEKDILNVKNNQEFKGGIVFAKPLVIDSDLNAIYINNMNFSNEYVLKNSNIPQIINSHKTFGQNLVLKSDLIVGNNTIDYVNVDELYSLSQFGFNKLTGDVIFENLKINGNVNLRKLNGLNVSELNKDYWLKNRRQKIDVPVKINCPVRIKNLNLKKLNEKNFPQEFVLNKPNQEQIILGPKTFVNAFISNGNLTTSPHTKFNNINLNKLNMKMVQNLQLINKRNNNTIFDYITGHKKFNTLVVEGNLFVNKLNGMQLEKDILLRNSPYEQIFTGKKTFTNNSFVKFDKQVYVGNDFYIKEDLNNVNIHEWYQDLVLKDSPELINKVIINKQFLNGLTTSELDVRGYLSGIDFVKFLSRAVFIDKPYQKINTPIIFSDPVEFNTLKLDGRFNNLNLNSLAKNLVYKSKNSQNVVFVNGKIFIKDKIFVKKDVNAKKIFKSVDLNEIKNRMLSKSRMNIVLAPYKFENLIFFNELNLIKTKINGVSPNDFILLRNNVTIPFNLIFKDEVIIKNQMFVNSGLVNGLNINNLFNSVMNSGNLSLNGNYGNIYFKYLDVKGNVYTKNNLVDKTNLNLIKNLSVLQKNREIDFPLTFTDTVSVGKLISKNKINGVRLDFILNDALLKNKNQNVPATKVFINEVHPKKELNVRKSFNVTGLVNKVNLHEFHKVLLKRDNLNKFSFVSTKFFNKPVHFVRDLKVLGKVNNLNIPQDIVSTTRNEFVNITVVFKKPVDFLKSFNVFKYVDKVPVINSFSNSIDLNKNNTNLILNSFGFRNKLKVDELIILKSINKIPVQFLVNLGVDKNFSNEVIRSKLIFVNDVNIDGNLFVDQKINDLNLTDISYKTIKINSNDYLPGKLIIDRRTTLNNTHLNNLLNGINLRKFENQYLKDKQIRGHYYDKTKYILNNNDHQLIRQVKKISTKPINLEYFDIYDEFDVEDDEGKDIVFDRFLTSPFVYDNIKNKEFLGPKIDQVLGWRIIPRGKRYLNSEIKSYCEVYETLTYELNEYDDLIIQNKKIKHRSFPPFKLSVQNSTLSENDSFIKSSFHLWSNTTGCYYQNNFMNRYAKENIPFEITMLYTTNFNKIGNQKRKIIQDSKNLKTNASINYDEISSTMQDSKFFLDDDNNLLSFVAFSYSKTLITSKINSMLYQFNAITNDWDLKQKILTNGATAIDIVHYYPKMVRQALSNYEKRLTLLAIANRITEYSYNRQLTGSTVYLFDNIKKNFNLISVIPTYAPKSVIFLPTFIDFSLNFSNSSLNKHEELFLIFANEKLRYHDGCSTPEDLVFEKSGIERSSTFLKSVSIYRFNDMKLNFEFYQEINVKGAITLDKFYLPFNQVYIVIGSKISHQTFIYKYDSKLKRFIFVQTLSTPFVENVKVFWSYSNNLYLMVASSKPGLSKRFKAFLNGPNLNYFENIWNNIKTNY